MNKEKGKLLFVELKHPKTGEVFNYPRCYEQKDFNSALSYKAKPNDIFVCAYPKCGTTWVQVIVWLIIHEGMPIPNYIRKFIPMLEFDGHEVVEAIDVSKYPRIIKTHFPHHFTPQHPNAKYIYVTRNPKDVLVSFWYHMRGFEENECRRYTSIEDMFGPFIEGRLIFGSYFDHLISWYKHENQPNIFFLLYENIKKDQRNNVLKIARFLGENYEKQLLKNNEEILSKVLENSTIEGMRNSSTKWVNMLSFIKTNKCHFYRVLG